MLATVQGYQVIVGLEAKDGDLGVFFPCDGQLTKEHLTANKLYSTHPDTGEKMGGYFGKNGRVRAQKLRGEISDGFWQEAKGFDWCGGLTLKDGDEFDTLNGHKICQKYYTPATQRAAGKGKERKKKAKISYPNFYEHYDTKQLRNNVAAIPKGAVIYVSEKLHGTSGRTGQVQPAIKRSWLSSFFRRLLNRQNEWVYVLGTRRTVKEAKENKDGYYGKDIFRTKMHDKIKQSGLHKGEIVYYEIVGFTETNRSIMAQYDIEDKKLKKRYGDKMTYTYGCDEYCCKLYVYRITQNTPDGATIDLSWDQMKARCQQLGLDVVPELDRFVYDGNTEELLKRVNKHTLGDSTLDNRHIREGVVCRVEHPAVYSSDPSLIALKYKSYHFCEMEGIKKNDNNYVDIEEIS